MDNTGYIQWENSNSGRNYPFAEDSTLTDDSGNEMPRDIISDTHVMMSSYESKYSTDLSPEKTRAFVSCVHLSPWLVSVSISRAGIPGGLLSCHVTRESFRPYTPFALNSYTDDTAGFVSFGDFEWPSSNVESHMWRFSDYSQSGIESTAVTAVSTSRVRRFIDDDSGKSISGKVTFSLPSYVKTRIDNDDVLFDLESSADTLFKDPCFKAYALDVCGAPAIQRINGISPNNNGEIALRFT